MARWDSRRDSGARGAPRALRGAVPGLRALRGAVLGLCALALAACAGGPPIDGGGGLDRGRVQFRMLDSVNALRTARGAPALGLDSALNAAAATHARDMAAQNRPWHFGSDGSSPPERAARAGYRGAFLGETISESFETEIETLAAWVDDPGPRSVLVDPLAREMGLGWHREASGRIWWVLVTGSAERAPAIPVRAAPSDAFGRRVLSAAEGFEPPIAPPGAGAVIAPPGAGGFAPGGFAPGGGMPGGAIAPAAADGFGAPEPTPPGGFIAVPTS